MTGSYSGATVTLENSSILDVTAAAAVSAMNSSWVGKITRPIVERVWKPASSACTAQSTRRRPGVPGMVLGRPIPMRNVNLLCGHLVPVFC